MAAQAKPKAAKTARADIMPHAADCTQKLLGARHAQDAKDG